VAFADLGTVRLFYTDSGRGDPPLLFVHGFACDSHDWSWQIPHFSSRHRVIAVDLRGHGRSSAPVAGYDPATYAADLAGLLGLLGRPSVVAVGHSMGGLVVSALAVEHPEMVSAVVAVDPAYLIADSTIGGLAPVLSAVGSADPVPIVQALLGASDTPDTPPYLSTWHSRRVAGMRPHVLVQTLLQMSAESGASTRFEAGREYLARRRAPVLSVYAEGSRVPVETALFSDPLSRALWWEGTGHWLHQERPDEFNGLLESWLESVLAVT
jgi:pimeloyl-ACP methyl ester carboxylesterase